MSSYKVLFVLRILKNVLTGFVESFFVLYFLDVSDNNILPLGLYKLVAIAAIYGAIFFTRNLAKSKYRIHLLRVGILLDLAYFCAIVLLKNRLVDHIYLVGVLYGLEEGIYYSVYNMVESDEITNEERAGFTGAYTAVQAVLSIAFPLVFGSLIHANGFIKSMALVVAIVLVRIFFSMYLKPKRIPREKKTNIREYLHRTRGNPLFKQLYITQFFYGLIFTEGAFAYIVTIYIVRVFSDSFSLGIFTSLFSLVTCVIGVLFAKRMRKEHYGPAVRGFMILTVICLIIMIFNCRAATIILFNLFYTVSKTLATLINENIQADLSNLGNIKKEYKVEYWLANETCFFAARLISNVLFIGMAFLNGNMIILVFAAFLLLLGEALVSMSRMMNKKTDKMTEASEEAGLTEMTGQRFRPESF